MYWVSVAGGGDVGAQGRTADVVEAGRLRLGGNSDHRRHQRGDGALAVGLAERHEPGRRRTKG